MKNILGTSIEELRLSSAALAEVLCAIDECINLIEREERGEEIPDEEANAAVGKLVLAMGSIK